MSDLVEKVQSAIAYSRHLQHDSEARAAIKAVAEWLLSNADDHETVQIAYRLEAQLEDRK